MRDSDGRDRKEHFSRYEESELLFEYSIDRRTSLSIWRNGGTPVSEEDEFLRYNP